MYSFRGLKELGEDLKGFSKALLVLFEEGRVVSNGAVQGREHQALEWLYGVVTGADPTADEMRERCRRHLKNAGISTRDFRMVKEIGGKVLGRQEVRPCTLLDCSEILSALAQSLCESDNDVMSVSVHEGREQTPSAKQPSAPATHALPAEDEVYKAVLDRCKDRGLVS